VKKNLTMYITTLTLLAALTVPVQLAAQDNASPNHKAKHHHYKLIDVGTFGGPSSLFSNPDSRAINNRGTATGFADTSIPDPYCVYDCLVNHAFVWKDGVTTDLGTLPGGASSFAYWVNNGGLIVGQSQNGSIDPLTGFPEFDGVLWDNGQIINLGTLGGNQSNASAINDHDQVVGGALNTIPDPFAGIALTGSISLGSFAQTFIFTPAATQTHAFLWRAGEMQDLGTLGGPDSNAVVVNDRGQVAGESFINFIADASGVPTMDPFLWEKGQMVDVGTLGGTFGFPSWLNNRGQVVGASNLPGDQTFHPFLWDRGALKDLGTLGGYTGVAFWINDAGEAVGYADLPPNPPGCTGLDCIHHAFLWRHGVMKDLGTLNDPCSRALSINLSGQVVGATSPCNGEFAHAFLWENGGPIIDLNTLVLHGSGLMVRDGDYINDRGEIAGRGVLPNGDVHAVLLIPCDEQHHGIEGCDYSLVDATAATQSPAPRYLPSETQRLPQSRRTNRYHIPGLQSPSR
jgi:probable HAF family extracellular repeat protein